MVRNLALVLAVGVLGAANVTAADWGGISGQVVVKGDAPAPVLLHAKGAPIKDAEVCAVADTYSEEVVVGKDSKGLANVFIYMTRAPKAIHPDLEKPADAKVVFDQKNCTFLPHAMIVRAGQSVEVVSSDPIAHNTHTYPLRNQAVNILIAPNTPKGSGVDVATNVAERLPIQVKCDYHPWMIAYWMIVDHPYAAITDKDGKFTIENLPEGDHEFAVWHEKVGRIESKLKISVAGGKITEVKSIEVDAAKLK